MFNVLMVFALVLAAPSASDETDVRRSFERYREALQRGDGKTAYAQIDSASRAYYEELLNKTKYATPAECAQFPTLDKLSILLARVQIPRDTLASFDGQDFFRYAVEHGWVSHVGEDSVAIESIEFETDEARVYIRHEQGVSPYPHVFKKESGNWRLSLVSMLPIGEASMHRHLERAGVDEQDFLFDAVEGAVGTRPTDQTWDPPLSRGG